MSTSKQYTDEQHRKIAEKEYEAHKVGDPVELDDKTTVGHVSEVVDLPNGLQSYVVTDQSPGAPAEQVNHVTVLYQGSRQWKDWTSTNIPVGLEILSSTVVPGMVKAPYIPPAQFRSSAALLKKTMAKYPNATVDVYGHSLGSMDGQYALASLNDEEIKRVSGGHLYQGPNIYRTLTPLQKRQVEKLNRNGNVHNYVDPKDIVGLVGFGGKYIGNLKLVQSIDAGGDGVGDHVSKQHNWGGYKFDSNGRLVLAEPDIDVVRNEVTTARRALDAQRSALAKAGGGALTGAQSIWLDEQEARILVSGMNNLSVHEAAEFEMVIHQAERQADEQWRNTCRSATAIGKHLNGSEVLDALAAGGATPETISNQHKDHYVHVLDAFAQHCRQFEETASNIERAIETQVSTDQALARQLEALQ